MPDYKNPIDGREYTDKQHVETALYEYRSMYVGKQYDVKGGGLFRHRLSNLRQCTWQ